MYTDINSEIMSLISSNDAWLLFPVTCYFSETFIFREEACFFESRQDGALKQVIQKAVSISLMFIVKVIQKRVCKSSKKLLHILQNCTT